jgi:hypothetical protein
VECSRIGLVVLASIALSGSARALSFDPNPVPVSHSGGGVAGDIELIEVVTGLPSGGQVLLGNVGPAATTIVLRGSVDAGSAEILYLGVREGGSPSNWVSFGALGWIPGADVDITSGIEGTPGTAGFLPASPPGAGQSFDLVFISYDGPLATDGTLEFVAALVLVPDDVGVATLVPEPGSPVSLAAALVGLACIRASHARRA